MSPPVLPDELSLLNQTGRTRIHARKVQMTRRSRQAAAQEQQGVPFFYLFFYMAETAADSYVWHQQEADANLQLCRLSPHRHPKCCCREVMSVVMATVCEPCTARPADFPVRSLAPPSPPSPPSLTLPTHSLTLPFPSHARKSIAETNAK